MYNIKLIFGTISKRTNKFPLNKIPNQNNLKNKHCPSTTVLPPVTTTVVTILDTTGYQIQINMVDLNLGSQK